tara:strand:- start:94 stop:576 length:483 start_codon:yes stop_codon:yes gene_type:complete
METLSKIVLYSILIFVIVISLVIFFVSQDEDEDEIIEKKPKQTKKKTQETKPKSTSPPSNQKTIATSEDMIFCLTRDKECRKMEFKTCNEEQLETYSTERDCASAKANLTGELQGTSRWCLTKNDDCIQVHQNDSNNECADKGFKRFQDLKSCEDYSTSE